MTSILNAFTLLLGVMFIAYVTSIIVPYLRHRPLPPGSPADFHWHLFIPCRDEAAVIDETISRARADFPDAHVWVIDDDSEDDTAALTIAQAGRDPKVHLVQRRRPDARVGKGAALNAAYRELNAWLPADADRSTVIVGVVDADGELAPNALEIVASAKVFGDPLTGAAQIAVWMKNRADRTPFPGAGRFRNAFASVLVRLQDIEFRTVIAAMQSLRSRTGTVGLGGNGQFTRLNVLDAIALNAGEPWHGALLEDYELGVHVLLAGYQVQHVYDTHVSQEALPSLRRLLTQRTRWAQGNIQCVKYLVPVFQSKHFSGVGVIETSYYLVLPFLQMLGAAAFLTLSTVGIIRASTEPTALALQVDALWAIGVLILVFSVAPFAIWGFVYKVRCEPQATWLQAAGWGAAMWLYVYYMYVCIARAFYRIARGKSGWSKTRRNAEAHTVVNGSVAVER